MHVRLSPSFQTQAAFYANRFRAPAVATKDQLQDYAKQLQGDTAGSFAIAEVTREAEAAAARMDGRSEVVILATSILLSAGVVLLSTGSGIRWLELVATLCSFVSLILSLFAYLAYVGRRTLGLGPENASLDELARRLSTKAALSAHAVVLLYPASIALVVSALVT